MDEDKFNMSMRKFLKQVGVTSQQQIEKAIRNSGKSSGSVAVKMTLSAEGIELNHEVKGEIDLG